jgi:hypothetical protein
LQRVQILGGAVGFIEDMKMTFDRVNELAFFYVFIWNESRDFFGRDWPLYKFILLWLRSSLSVNKIIYKVSMKSDL